jgi:hypothetical protein
MLEVEQQLRLYGDAVERRFVDEATSVGRPASSRRRGAVLALAAAVAVIGALVAVRTQQPGRLVTQPTNQAEGKECDASEGSSIDVKHEPAWRLHGDYRPWTDQDGCLLRIDVLAERSGAAHCGWEQASVMMAGRPLGSRYTTPEDAVEYVKDPNGVFGLRDLAQEFDPDAELPGGAVDTGFRRAGSALWHVPGDQTAVWVVAATGIERWPAGRPPGCQ